MDVYALFHLLPLLEDLYMSDCTSRPFLATLTEPLLHHTRNLHNQINACGFTYEP